jgi:hypothetical protein
MVGRIQISGCAQPFKVSRLSAAQDVSTPDSQVCWEFQRARQAHPLMSSGWVASDHGVRNIRQALASPHSAFHSPVRRGLFVILVGIGDWGLGIGGPVIGGDGD